MSDPVPTEADRALVAEAARRASQRYAAGERAQSEYGHALGLMIEECAVEIARARAPAETDPSRIYTNEQFVKRIIAMLPDNRAEGLHILDAARRMVDRFKR